MPYKNLEDKKEAAKRWWSAANKERSMLSSARHRAKVKQLEFNISEEDIVIPDFCPITLSPIEKERVGRKGPGPNSPTLDRIDNSKGYVKGNVRVISYRANQKKSDLSLDEIKRLYEYSQI